MYKNLCSRILSIKILTNSEHIPLPILQVKAFQIFLSSIFTFPFPHLSLSRKNKTKKPGTAAVPKIAKSKPGHNCRACFFPPFPFPFNLQRSPSAIFLFTSTASLNIEKQKEPQVLPSEFPMEHLTMSSSSFKRGFVGNEEGITPLLCAGANGRPACWPAVGLCAAWLVN